MGCITRTVGRLLFVTLLVSSAYLHLSKPQNYTEDFSSNYTELHQCVGKHLPGYLPPADFINWTLLSKVFGLFEVLTAGLILFGDCWGGVFLFFTLIVSGYFDYKDVCSILQWDVTRQLEFARYVFFVGASLALMSCTKSNNKSCKQVVQKEEKAVSK